MKESFLLDEKKNPISIVTLFVIPLKKPMSQNEYDKEELALWSEICLFQSFCAIHSMNESLLSVILVLDDI